MKNGMEKCGSLIKPNPTTYNRGMFVPSGYYPGDHEEAKKYSGVIAKSACLGSPLYEAFLVMEEEFTICRRHRCQIPYEYAQELQAAAPGHSQAVLPTFPHATAGHSKPNTAPKKESIDKILNQLTGLCGLVNDLPGAEKSAIANGQDVILDLGLRKNGGATDSGRFEQLEPILEALHSKLLTFLQGQHIKNHTAGDL